MSVPTSVRAGPFTPTVLVRKRYLFFYIFLIWISTICIIIELYIYWHYLNLLDPFLTIFLMPILFFVMYVTVVVSSLVFAKILLIIVNKIHKPCEGVFLRIDSDKDYRYWSLRNTIKRWPIWISHKFPLPFLDNLCLKMFGVKTKFSNSLFEGWMDTEFIDCGQNVVIGQGSIIQSAVIIGHLLIIKKTVIEDNVRIGAHSIVMPGTILRRNSILAANSVTTIGQELEEGWIYVGIPTKKFKENHFFDDGLEEILGHVEDVDQLRTEYEKLYTKRYDQEISSNQKDT